MQNIPLSLFHTLISSATQLTAHVAAPMLDTVSLDNQNLYLPLCSQVHLTRSLNEHSLDPYTLRQALLCIGVGWGTH